MKNIYSSIYITIINILAFFYWIWVYDIIYNPSKTHFLKLGEQTGNKIENGKMMFIYQASEAFKLWHEVKPKIDDELKNFLDLWKE